MLDVKLLKAIYGPEVETTGYSPYRVFADGGETYGMSGVIHLPGKQGWIGGIKQLEEKEFHGYIGITVPCYSEPIERQTVRHCWSAIDIDNKDNPQFETPMLVAMVRGLFKGHAIIRMSKSGKGIHLIFPTTPTSMPYESAGAAAKQAVLHPMVQLANAGIATCATGLTNLWLWSVGGKQETVEWL